MEKRQHSFLRDGRQALEGKLNLSKDAVGALRKDSRFVARFTHPRFLHVFVYWRFIYRAFSASFQRERKLVSSMAAGAKI